MKKIITFSILLFVSIMPSVAENTIVIPADFLHEITKTVEIKTDATFIQRLLVNQIIKSTTINGVEIKDLKSADLIDIFTSNGVFKKVSDNKLIEPNTGATLLFDSVDNCKKDKCEITLDLNGDDLPNELWVDSSLPKDRVKFIVKKDKDGALEIQLPDCIK